MQHEKAEAELIKMWLPAFVKKEWKNEKQKHDLKLMSFQATAATETSGGHASGTTSTGPAKT